MNPLKSLRPSLNLVLSIAAFLAVAHFLYFLLFDSKEFYDTRVWEQKTCYFKEGRDIVDGDCRYYHAKDWIFAQPNLAYGERLNCFRASSPRGQQLLSAEQKDLSCGAPQHWGSPQRFIDIGWDAYSIWWGRSAVLFQRSTQADWPGFHRAIFDPGLRQAFPNQEHWHYPWGVSLIYFAVMKALDSPNPLALQLLQIALLLLSVYMFHRVWPTADKRLLLVFALVPTAGVFAFRLYADLWVLTGLLFFIDALQRKQRLLALGLGLLIPWLKAEAFVHVLAILFACFFQWKKENFWRDKKWVGLFFVLCFGSIFAHLFQEIFKSPDFYVPLSERMSLEGALLFLRSILPYYLDVFFRPSLWGLLWPIVLYVLWKKRRELFPSALALLGLWFLIPLAFLTFPFGHKEVVLTGSGRGLWQCLPLAWYLLKQSKLEISTRWR